MTKALLLLAGPLCLTAADAPKRTFDGPFRLEYHFTPPRNWTNDPNGLVYYKGEYHLFYQYNPFGTKWGHMSWGHAVSPDLLHWRDLPVALQEEDGVMVFSGSAVVDEHNSSGLCRNRDSSDRSCLVAIYTGHTATRQTQNIASSNDRGRTWMKYKGNPVLDLGLKDFRDPKVMWYAEMGDDSSSFGSTEAAVSRVTRSDSLEGLERFWPGRRDRRRLGVSRSL